LSPLRSHETCLLLAVATTVLACSSSSGVADYTGDAYPDRRPSFEPADRRLGYLANLRSDTVSVVDLDAMELLGSVPVGRDPVDIDGPRHVALDLAADLAYVVLSYPDSVPSPHLQGAVQRSSYVEALRLSDLSVAGDLRIDAGADDVAFAPATGALAATHYDLLKALQPNLEDRRTNLALVDQASAIASGEGAARKVPLCVAPTGVAFNADGSRAYVACTGEDAVAVVDPGSGEVLARVPAGVALVNQPYAIVIDDERQRLVTANRVASTLSVFELSDEPSLLATLSVPGQPMFPAWIRESTLAAPFQEPGGAALFDVTSGELLTQIQYTEDECEKPSELKLLNDGRLLLVCEGSHYDRPGAVVELDPETLEVRARVKVDIYPERIAIYEP
jgi:DNA-binding beta-propeller fold protein YncE